MSLRPNPSSRIMWSLTTAAAIRPALLGLPLLARTTIEALILARGTLGPARDVAQALGLANRFELARQFRRAGLPPLHRLAAWVSVLAWLEEAERSGVSLCQQAFLSKRDAGGCYRMVKRVTGRSWSQLRQLGLGWLVQQFMWRCLGMRPVQVLPRRVVHRFRRPAALPRSESSYL
jgi:hypothetical protein